MGEKIVRFSDLSGQMAPDPTELVSIIVEHPELDGPVRIEALPAELEPLGKFAIKAVGLEVELPGEEAATRYTVTATNFDKLATDRPMAEVLDGAEPVKRRNGRSAPAGGQRDHNTLEWAGTPHKGKTSPEEARLVRENLDVINERLTARGLRTIDPGNPEHARRYGLDARTEMNGG